MRGNQHETTPFQGPMNEANPQTSCPAQVQRFAGLPGLLEAKLDRLQLSSQIHKHDVLIQYLYSVCCILHIYVFFRQTIFLDPLVACRQSKA